MNSEKNRFNVEEHTTLDGKIIDVFPVSHRYIHELEQQVKKQKEVIDKATNFLKKWGEEPDADMYIQMKEYKEFNELLDILKEVSE